MSLEQFVDSRIAAAMNVASALAATAGSRNIRPEHLFAALLRDDHAIEILKQAGGDVKALLAAHPVPNGGEAARGRQLATLGRLAHEKFIDPEEFDMVKNEDTGKCECAKGFQFDFLERKCLEI